MESKSLICYLMLPLVQYEKTLKFISTAKSEGATILTGGARPEVYFSAFTFYFLFLRNYLLGSCWFEFVTSDLKICGIVSPDHLS